MTEPSLGERAATARPRILCVDDEPNVLEGLKDVLHRSFDVRVATGGASALEMLRDEPDEYAIIISDMRMPLMSGTELLRQAKGIAPDAARILLTGYADLDAAITAVNDASLFRYLTKPCQSAELLRACAAALGHHRHRSAERSVLEETLLHASVDALVELLALSNPAAFGRGSRVKRWQRVLLGRSSFRMPGRSRWRQCSRRWAITLPQATADKLDAGQPLDEIEEALVERVPDLTRDLIGKIPRLDGVLDILDKSRQPTAVDTEDLAAVGAHVLRIARDYDSLESEGAMTAVAVGAMRSRATYERRFIDVLANVVGVGRSTPAVREVHLADVRIGMTFASDVVSVNGAVLVARGQQVSRQLRERLTNLGPDVVRQPLRTFASEPGT